jgi:hypothetical protein
MIIKDKSEEYLNATRIKVEKMMEALNPANDILTAGHFKDYIFFEVWRVFGDSASCVIIEYILSATSAPAVFCFLQEKGTSWESMKVEIEALTKN